jgi:hypothetical protein
VEVDEFGDPPPVCLMLDLDRESHKRYGTPLQTAGIVPRPAIETRGGSNSVTAPRRAQRRAERMRNPFASRTRSRASS